MTTKLKNPQNQTALLLIVITALLGFLGFIGKKQLESTNEMINRFNRFQIENAIEQGKQDNDRSLIYNWTHDVYQREIHPNTIRSQKNEKDIIKVKSDVSNLKSILK